MTLGKIRLPEGWEKDTCYLLMLEGYESNADGSKISFMRQEYVVLQEDGTWESYVSTLYGDVNLDGRVDITDAVMLNKAVAGVVRLTNQAVQNGDCNANSELGVELERRRFGGVDRTWSTEEFNHMLGRALAAEHWDYILALYLARYAGLRIHECFRMDTAAAEQALRENAVTVKGKGGKIRTVPINEQIAIALRRQLARTQRGHKLLVPDEMPTDQAIHRLQLFIVAHRSSIQVRSDPPLTFHGLRHTFAAEKYKELMDKGMGALDAHFTVSRLLGHERADVTNVYLASLSAKDMKDKH